MRVVLSLCLLCRWGTENRIRHVRWCVFPGFAGTKPGTKQGTCADRCRPSGRSGRIWDPDRPVRSVTCSFSLTTQRLLDSIEGQVNAFPLDALEAMDPLAGMGRAERISSHTSFFKSGVCSGRTFVCVVETSPLSSTIRIFEPIDQRGRSKPTLGTQLQGGHDTLRMYKEFFIPVQSSSIHFLRTKLCVTCVNGFEIIDPDTLDTQGLLDPTDESLDFVQGRSDKTRPKPIAFYCIENKFLLCYNGTLCSVAYRTKRGGTELMNRVRVLHRSRRT